MNKVLVGLALASSVILSACGDGPAEPIIPGVDSGSGSGGPSAQMSPVYSPASGSVPVPNDLLFLGSEDLTLNIPNSDPSASNPITAINALDGWSTHAPFTISFTDNGATLDSTSLTLGQSFRIFKTSVLRSEVQPGIIAPTGPVTGIEAELVPGVDYVAQVAGPLTVAVVPLRPFEPQASYMVVLTNGLTDSNGTPLSGDSSYNLAKSTEPLGGAAAALEPIRQLVNAMLAAAATQGIESDDAILSYQFTIQSVADSLVAAKGFYIDLPFSQGALPATSFSSLMTDTTPFTGIGAANLYKGQMTLPYLSGIPSAATPTAILDDSWVAADFVPVGGNLVPNPLAGGNLTYANPLPQKQGDETVPLLVSLPKNPACPKPYPVMIFQHGITSDRTAMLGIADTMAGACNAVVSMDQPLHGIAADNPVHLGLQAASGGLLGIFEGYIPGGIRERTFGVDFIDNATGAPGPDGNVDASGAHTINLLNLLASRDNLRQASLDLLTLEKAIPGMDIDGDSMPDLDASKVSFMGHSLGGIVGSNYTALADLAQQSIIATASGSIAQMLNASESFGPRIRAGVAAGSGEDPTDPAFLAGTLQSFLVAAQTVVDSGDPINYATIAQANNIPTLSIQVRGDSVVPNAAPGAPLAGSIPHAALYGLATVTDTTMTDRAFMKFVSGNHATPLSPAGANGPTEFLAETTAMQTAIATFIASGGTQVVVTDTALVEP
ncbi:hypothetical protein [Kangiella sp. HZ709]|uniref:hypothetical protein n=1 Tax=Kangiella sp. HZ709 TaxID=2666328 RepID=UPI0012B0A678|nr:hypothetical protein [Kangiella sp. HZ709]MRX28463.1 hypothetical protein [Kangiella sp. HZ709]